MPIKKILVVDDSPTERYFMTDLLVKNGYSVSTAESGEEALDKIKSDKPDLILMDVVMPGKNGFQVTRMIARDPEMQNVTVIICTSKDQETDRVWGLRQGAHDYLVKPIDPQVLLEKIKALG
ncbi:MAG: response regulator [Oxalobacter sp.]|nr:MAG: response regulator [Oxalobacter sp.]